MKSTRLHRNKTVVGISPALRSRTTRQDPTHKNRNHHARQPHQHPFQRIPSKLPNKHNCRTYVRKHANGIDFGEFHGDSSNSLQINDRGIHRVQRLLQVSHRNVQRNIHQLAELSSPSYTSLTTSSPRRNPTLAQLHVEPRQIERSQVQSVIRRGFLISVQLFAQSLHNQG